jgi:hypothetical protein
MLYELDVRDHLEFAGRFYSLPELDAAFQEFNATHHCADKVRVLFWGGPPGKEDWVKGTLRMFLLDQIFRIEADNEVFDMLYDLCNERFPGLLMTTMSRRRSRVRVRA